jgi:hypothetical protein
MSTQYIDMTPTWTQVLPLLRRILENGDDEGRAHVWAEIARMAHAADEWNALLRDHDEVVTNAGEELA